MNYAKQPRNTTTNHKCSLCKSTSTTMPNMQKQRLDNRRGLCGFASISSSNPNTDGRESISLSCHNLFKMWQYSTNQLNNIGIQTRGFPELEGQRKCRTTQARKSRLGIWNLKNPSQTLINKLREHTRGAIRNNVLSITGFQSGLQ